MKVRGTLGLTRRLDAGGRKGCPGRSWCSCRSGAPLAALSEATVCGKAGAAAGAAAETAGTAWFAHGCGSRRTGCEDRSGDEAGHAGQGIAQEAALQQTALRRLRAARGGNARLVTKQRRLVTKQLWPHRWRRPHRQQRRPHRLRWPHRLRGLHRLRGPHRMQRGWPPRLQKPLVMLRRPHRLQGRSGSSAGRTGGGGSSGSSSGRTGCVDRTGCSANRTGCEGLRKQRWPHW